MDARLLADALLALHGLFILFVVFGGLLALRWPKMVWVHLPAALWGAAIEFGGWVCPLTPLENHFRRLAGEQGYAGGFVQHYMLPLIYPGVLTREIQIGFGLLVVGVNGIVYYFVWRRRR